MGESIDKLIPKNQKKAQAGQDWLQELNAGQPQQGVLQQMQPLLNQLLGHHGGKSTRLNMDGTLKDMNAPSGLDWLEAHGPDRANVQARYERLGQELRPDGGLPWMAQQGAQAVEAQKQLQQMLPQAQHSVTQQWGGDDVGAVSTAMKDGLPVGFSTNTPQAKALHQFSPHDFVAMLGQLPKAAPAAQGSVPQAGDAQLPVNSFVGQTSNSPDTFSNRDRAGVRAREQERQRHNVYKDQVQPNFMDYLGAIGDTLNTVGTEQGNWISELLGYKEQLPKISKLELPTPAFVGPPQTQLASPQAHVQPSAAQGFWDSPLGWLLQAIDPKNLSGLTSVGEAIGLPWLTPAEGQQLKQKLNEQATYRFPW